jgi:hypothetical protein
MEWHRDRSQRPGYVTDARMVEFVLFNEDRERQAQEAEAAM